MKDKLLTFQCKHCGKEVKRYSYHLKRRVYCSKQCYFADNSMDKSSLWKGGKYTCREGYYYIYQPQHPSANSSGYVYEHILVTESILGRPLNKGEVVHHLNGIKTDNRPENITVITKGEHSTLHHKLTNQWSKNYAQCVVCGGTQSRHESHGLCGKCNQRRLRRLEHENRN